jgi:hypothetical protein
MSCAHSQANVTALSPELRDLLDKIFVMDEFKRITIQVGVDSLNRHVTCVTAMLLLVVQCDTRGMKL